MKFLPIARTTDLAIKNVEDETLIYDLKTHRALCLNKTSSLIWTHCDGNTSVKDIAKKYKLNWETIELALDEFQKNNLLKNQVETQVPTDRIARRKFMMKAGAMAMALPLVTMIVAPPAVAAQSGCFGPGNAPPSALPPDVPIANIIPPETCLSYCMSNTNCCIPATGAGATVGAMCHCTAVICG